MSRVKSLEEFSREINEDSWYAKSPEERLAFLQELENVMAARGHRPPMKIIVLSDEEIKERPGLMGYQTENVIAIRPEYIRRAKPNPAFSNGLAQFSMGDALNTVIHEGRHAWQRYVVAHPELKIVSDVDRLAMRTNMDFYVGGGSLPYVCQCIEMDARKYAIETMAYILRYKERVGDVCGKEIAQSIRTSLNRELQYALMTVKNKDLMQYVENLEIGISSGKLTPRHPGSYQMYSFFAQLKKLFATGDLRAFVESPSIRIINPKFAEKIDKVGIEPVKEKADQTKVSVKHKFV